jgi:hypothetical protein
VSNDDPIGLHCPGCGQHATMMITGGCQAFCSNDDCKILMWDPAQSVNEMAPKLHVIDLDRDDGKPGH